MPGAELCSLIIPCWICIMAERASGLVISCWNSPCCICSHKNHMSDHVTIDIDHVTVLNGHVTMLNDHVTNLSDHVIVLTICAHCLDCRRDKEQAVSRTCTTYCATKHLPSHPLVGC